MTIERIAFSGNANSRSTHRISELLSYAENSNRIKAVILVINSGGGDASSSEKLVDGIRKLREKKPIFSVIEGIGASGAYWMASATNKIYAMRTSIVGSIGVIGINPDVSGLMNKLGINIEMMKVGQYKDMLTPFAPTSEEAKEKYMKILENSYAVLKNSVSENRKLTPENLELSTNGEIFTAIRAQEIGLIDKIGTCDEALGDMAKTYQLKPKLKLLEPHRFLFERMFMSNSFQALIYRLFDM